MSEGVALRKFFRDSFVARMIRERRVSKRASLYVRELGAGIGGGTFALLAEARKCFRSTYGAHVQREFVIMFKTTMQ